MNSGYTLLELLVVIAVVGLVVGLAAPATVSTVDGARLRADARSLVTDLRSLQMKAQKTQQSIVVSATASGGLAASGEALTLPNQSEAYIAGDAHEIAFFPDGTTSGGRVRLNLGDRRVDINITWLTGETLVEAQP